MQTVFKPDNEKHLYRLSLRSRQALRPLVVGLVLSLGIAFCLYPLMSFRDWRMGVTGGGSTALVLAFLYFFTSTLTIMPEGFVYSTFTRSIEGQWAEVEAITRLPGRYMEWLFGEGLLLRSDPRYQSRWKHLSRNSQRDRFVPLEPFAPFWRESGIGSDIRQYAPWLIDAPFNTANASKAV